MSVKAKDQTGGDLCKSHTARCDKDYLRVCPSKLSKRELEDLYYSLLENNLELKRAVNSQNEKIRNLSTKVQRLTAQNRTSLTKEPKECCAAAKVAISEQRLSIADLKKANECMAERIRRLNMRLCSAKQFLKRSPNQCATKCFNCITSVSTSVKNLSTSALHDKSEDIDNLRSVALSAQSVIKKSTRTVETNTPEHYNVDKVKTGNVCDENQCRTTMEEFQRKIFDLQEELSKTHTEYSARMSQLEEQVSVLRAAASRSNTRRSDDAQLLARRQRDASAAAELETQLKLERGKVAELEMRLKAADMSQEVARTIERHLSNVSLLEEKRRVSRNDSGRCNICMSPRFTLNEAPDNEIPDTSPSKRHSQLAVPEDKHCKSEDSGYAENRENEKDGSMNSVNRGLMQRVAYLQAQIDAVKLTVDNPEQSPTSIIHSKTVVFDSYDVVIQDPDVPMLKNVKDYNCVIIDPAKKVIVEIEHVNDDSKEKPTINPGQNSPNEDTKQTQEGNASSKQRDSLLPKHQLKFESPSNQHGSSQDWKELGETKSQSTKKGRELDQLSQRSSTDSKLNPYFSNIVSRLDGDQKTNNHGTEDVRTEDSDRMVSSHHTLHKSDGQDSVSNMRDTAATDTPHQVKVLCHYPKCAGIPENGNVPGTNRLSDEIGDCTEIYCQQDEEPLGSQKELVKRVSQLMGTGLPRRVSQETMSPRPNQETAVNDEKTSKIPIKTKNDRHNSLQIPGPLPTDKRYSTFSKISKANEKNEAVKGPRGKRKATGISMVGIYGNEPTVPIKKENFGAMQNSRFTSVVNGKTVDNVSVNEKRQAVSNNKFGDVNENWNEEAEKESRLEPDVEEDFDKATCSRNLTKSNGETLVTGSQTVTGQEQRIGPNASHQTRVGPKPEPSRPLTPSPGNTYNVPQPEVQKSRASSPENTENEISGMTDLPTERDDGTTPGEVLSPGEHKASTIYTDSYTPGQDQLLSEGEVPNGTAYSKRKVSMSMGEYPDNKEVDEMAPYNQESSASRMEAALQAISQELARCRSLLHSQRPREVTYGSSIV